MSKDDALIPAELPNDSPSLGVYEPELEVEAQEEERQERGVAASGVPILADLLAWFDEMIEGSDSVTQVRKTAKEYGCTIENALIAHDLVASLLQSKRGETESRVNAFFDPDRQEDEDDE